MKKRKIGAMVLAIVLMAFSMAVPLTVMAQEEHEVEIPQLEGEEYAQGDVLVSMSATKAAALTKEGTAGFNDKIEVEKCWDFGKAENASSDRVKDYVALVHSDTYSTEELMEILSRKYYVDAVSPNSEMHLNAASNDEFASYQWYLNGRDSFMVESPGIRHAQMPVTPVSEPVVAVIDTGVDYSNPDLQDSMWVNPYEAQGLPGTYGYDFGNNDADPMDTYGHGSHCAGIIAAQTNNNIGIAGISNAKIMALKITEDGEESLYAEAVISALGYVLKAQEFGANVVAVNCSWGGGQSGNALEVLINKVGQNGALVIFAAGNDGVDWGSLPESLRETPFDIHSQYIVIVGASDENDAKAVFSDYSVSQMDLLAPGNNLLSTIHEKVFRPMFWTEAKRNALTSYYSTVNSITNLYTASQIGVSSDYTTSIEMSANAGFIDKLDGCLKYTVSYGRNPFGGTMFPRADAQSYGVKEQAGFIYLDVTDLNMDPNATYYISWLMAEGSDTDQLSWMGYEKTSTPSNTRFVTIEGRTYLALVGVQTTSLKKTSYYFDNFAVSIANPDTSLFEKYDLESGTSMAAPVVAAAVASIRSAYPNLDVDAARQMLVSSVRYLDNLDNVCITGGILDLSQIPILASELTLNITETVLNYGDELTIQAMLAPANVSNAELAWSSSNTDYADVDKYGKVTAKAAGIGKTVEITAATMDGTGLSATCKVQIQAVKAQGIVLNKTSATVRHGKKIQLKATVLPLNVTNGNVTWSTSNKKYATVSAKGKVKVKKAGIGKVVKITARTADGTNLKKVCKIKIR